MSICDNVYDRTAFALELLIRNVFEIQDKQHRRRQCDCKEPCFCIDVPRDKHWLKEFCTIKLSGPRQTGHTTAAFKIIPQLFKHPVFVFHNHDQARRYLDILEQIAQPIEQQRVDEAGRTVTSRYMHKNSYTHHNVAQHLKGKTCDCIVIDCAFLMPEKQLDALYEMAIACSITQQYFCIILLQ